MSNPPSYPTNLIASLLLTAIDSSVLLEHAPASIAALHRAASEGSLAICDAVLAEIVPVLAAGDLAQFLADWKLSFLPSTQQVAVLAGEMFRAYLDRGGKRGRVAPDFLIAAHAQQLADRLLAGDRGYYRDYFKRLDLWDPSGKQARLENYFVTDSSPPIDAWGPRKKKARGGGRGSKESAGD